MCSVLCLRSIHLPKRHLPNRRLHLRGRDSCSCPAWHRPTRFSTCADRRLPVPISLRWLLPSTNANSSTKPKAPMSCRWLMLLAPITFDCSSDPFIMSSFLYLVYLHPSALRYNFFKWFICTIFLKLFFCLFELLKKNFFKTFFCLFKLLKKKGVLNAI